MSVEDHSVADCTTTIVELMAELDQCRHERDGYFDALDKAIAQSAELRTTLEQCRRERDELRGAMAEWSRRHPFKHCTACEVIQRYADLGSSSARGQTGGVE